MEMWYPPWFDSFESFALSVACALVFGVLLRLVRIHETLRAIEKELGKRVERDRKEAGDGTKDGE